MTAINCSISDFIANPMPLDFEFVANNDAIVNLKITDQFGKPINLTGYSGRTGIFKNGIKVLEKSGANFIITDQNIPSNVGIIQIAFQRVDTVALETNFVYLHDTLLLDALGNQANVRNGNKLLTAGRFYLARQFET